MGTVAEHVDGVYTGRLVGDMLHGPAKAEAIKALAARESLDLSRCSAYSDSYNDLPMLTLVGDPCAINPDAKLRAHAREQGWRIRDYRTGRKAARAGLVVGAVAGAVTGAVAAGVSLRGRRQLRPSRAIDRSCVSWATNPSRGVTFASTLGTESGGAEGGSPVPGLGHDVARGLEALREAVACALSADPPLAVAVAGTAARRTPPGAPHPLGWLLSEAVANDEVGASSRTQTRGTRASATPTRPRPPRRPRRSAPG